MATARYITRVELAISGQDLTDDIKMVDQKAYEKAIPVKLMYRTGSALKTMRWEVDLDYAIPQDRAAFDFESVDDETLIVTYDSGEQVRFGGVTFKGVADVSADGEAEVVKKISFICKTKNGSTGA